MLCVSHIMTLNPPILTVQVFCWDPRPKSLRPWDLLLLNKQTVHVHHTKLAQGWAHRLKKIKKIATVLWKVIYIWGYRERETRSLPALPCSCFSQSSKGSMPHGLQCGAHWQRLRALPPSALCSSTFILGIWFAAWVFLSFLFLWISPQQWDIR